MCVSRRRLNVANETPKLVFGRFAYIIRFGTCSLEDYAGARVTPYQSI